MSRPPRPLLGEAFAPVLSAARSGAAWGFERLYNHLAPSVAAYGRLRGATDPEGLTNDVFLGVFKGLSAFTGDEQAFRSWVFTIAHRRIVDERRRAAARPPTVPLGEADPVGGDVEDDALAALGLASAREVLRALSPDQRDVLLLRIVGDLTVDQVAHVVGKKPNAVKQLQRRGLESLRREISRKGVTL